MIFIENENVEAPKRRSSLEVLIEKSIKNRRKSYKLRKIPLEKMFVNIETYEVTIGDTIVVCNDIPSLITYLETEITKSEMLKESVTTKRFNAAEYQKLKDIQLSCVTPFIFDKEEKEDTTLV